VIFRHRKNLKISL